MHTVISRASARRWVGAIVGLGLALALAAPAGASGSPGTMTINKVDSTGALLPGGSFDGWTCSKFDGDPDLTCVSLKDYPWFAPGMTEVGTSGDSYTTDIPRVGGWDLPITECLVLRETAAPIGYAVRTGPAFVCRGAGGWTEQNAVAALRPGLTGVELDGTLFKPGLGDWTVTNDATTLRATINLVNERVTTPKPIAPSTSDPCNPDGTATNVAWAGALPANTATVRWSEANGTRTATLVDPVAVAWSDLTTAPLAFPLPADAGVRCAVPATPGRGIGANTGVDDAR